MTNRIGNKDQAQHRSKQEKREIKRANKEREIIRQAAARAKYRNEPKGRKQGAVVPSNPVPAAAMPA
jgi:predicted alpha/beta superfamily hydrolase